MPIAHAGVITGVDSITGDGLCSTNGQLLFTNDPNNDNVLNAAASTAVGFDEIIFEHTGAIDIVFNVSDSGGVTEYSVIESIFNFSQPTWSAFDIQLGFGTGSSFQLAGAGLGLDFDFPDLDSTKDSNIFGTLLHDTDSLHWQDGTLPPGFVDALLFALDVRDGLDQFTLRHTPVAHVVPAPATALLLLPGMLLVPGVLRPGRRGV